MTEDFDGERERTTYRLARAKSEMKKRVEIQDAVISSTLGLESILGLSLLISINYEFGHQKNLNF